MQPLQERSVRIASRWQTGNESTKQDRRHVALCQAGMSAQRVPDAWPPGPKKLAREPPLERPVKAFSLPLE